MGPRTGVGLQKRQNLASIQDRQAAIGRGGGVGRTVLAVKQGDFAEQLARAQNSQHQRLPVGRRDADPDIAVQHRHHMVARRPLQKDGLAGCEVADADTDAGEERFSLGGFEAGEQPTLAEKPASVLDQTAIGFNLQLHVPPAIVLQTAQRLLAALPS